MFRKEAKEFYLRAYREYLKAAATLVVSFTVLCKSASSVYIA